MITVFLTCALGLPAPLAIASSVGDAPATPLTPASRTVASCLQHSDRLLVATLADTSGSLHYTDPDARRVDALSAAMIGLERLASEQGPPLRVEVLLAGFAGAVDVGRAGSPHGWRALDPGSIDGVLQDIERFGSRDRARDTDYVLAWNAGRNALDQRAAELEREGHTVCKVAVFVSDGRYQLLDRLPGSTDLPPTVPYAPGVRLDVRGGGARAVEQGRIALCRPGGVMDQIADAHIVKFAVALTASPKFSPSDRRYLGAITTGDFEGERCGSRLSADTGAFVDVHDANDLIFAFADILHGPQQVEKVDVTCPFRPCTAGSRSFDAVPGLGGFTLTAISGRPGVAVTVTPPHGTPEILAPDGTANVSLPGASVSQQWTNERSLTAQASFAPGTAWQGRWTVTFVAPSGESLPPPSYALRLQSALHPELVAVPQLVRGGRSLARVRLVDGEGAPARGGPLAGSASLNARLVGPGVRERVPVVKRDGAFEMAIAIPSDARSGNWALELETAFAAAAGPVDPVFASLPLPDPASAGGPSLPMLLIWAGGILIVVLPATALLLIRRRRSARFPAPQTLRVFSSQAHVVPGICTQLEPEPSWTNSDPFQQLAADGRDAPTRRIERDGFSLVASAGIRQRATATAGDLQILGGTVDGPFPALADRRACALPFGLRGVWLFAVEEIDDQGEISGRILAFTTEQDDIAHGRSVLEAARAALRVQNWKDFDETPARASTVPLSEIHNPRTASLDDGWPDLS